MIQAGTAYDFDEVSASRYPIQFVSVGSLQNVPAPLIRVSTCGGIKLEVLQEVVDTNPPLGRYQVVTLEQRPKGSSTALTLLKVLTSRPDYYASKDWLTEHLPRMRRGENEDEEEGWGRGLVRVDNVVCLLRGLLCPSGIAGEDRLRKLLVVSVKNHRDSGPGYQLATTPLLWLDVDAIATLVRQACQREQDGQDALWAWEQVYALASKGSYLAQEMYSDWAADKQAEIEGYLKQAVLALHRLLLVRYDQVGEDRALLLLRSYWQTHPADEDVLRPLMELLNKRGCVQEALDCYQRLCQLLEQEGGTPSRRTQQTLHDLHIKQSQAELASPDPILALPSLNTASAFSSSSQDALLSFTIPALSQNIVGAFFTAPLLARHLDRAGSEDQALAEMLIAGATFLAPLCDRGWSLSALLEIIQIVLPVVKAIQMITRRQFLQNSTITLMGSLPYLQGKQVAEEERLLLCQALEGSIATGWKLFTLGKNAQALAVSQAQLVLLHHMHPLLPVYERSVLFSSVYNFLGVVLRAQKQYHEALDAHSHAYVASLGAGETLGVAYSLLSQADDYASLGQYSTAIEVVQQSLRTLGALGEQQPSLTRAHLLGIWADCAMTAGDYEMARQKLDDIGTLLDDLSPNEEFDRTNWYLLSGKCAGLSGDYAAAARWCEQAWQELPQESIMRRALALMPLLAAHACIRDLDASLLTLEKARQIIPVLHAPVWKQPLLQVLQQGFLIVFPHETRITSIVSELVPYLS
jgi:tetratricopeptide (TPR) repeat protein